MCGSKSPYVRSKQSPFNRLGCGVWLVILAAVVGFFVASNPYLKAKIVVGVVALIALFRNP